MRKRREKFDNRRRVDFTDSQADWLDSQADELKISFMAYVRRLVDQDMEQVSQNGDAQNTSKSGDNRARPNGLCQGLFTAEQVAQLINSVVKK